MVLSGRLILAAVVVVAATAILATATVRAYKLRDAFSAARSEVATLTHERQRLLDELAVARRRITELEIQSSSLPTTPQESKIDDPVPAAKRESVPLSHDSSATRETGNAWRLKQELSDIEENLALNPEERQEVSLRINDVLASGQGLNAAIRNNLLKDVIGPERFERYQEHVAQAEEQAFRESIAKEVIVLARELSLDAVQEEKLRAAYSAIERSLQPRRVVVQQKMREAMALHFEGEPGKERLQVAYDDIRTLQEEIRLERNRALIEQIGGELTDEQKNALLALQAREK